jgi:DNA-binding MarR family transcriptional regulator
MSHTTYVLLARLSAAPGRAIRLTDLAEFAKITRSRLSHTLTKLERDGWIRRIDDPADKRGQLAVLTDEGYGALEGAAPGHAEAVRRAVFDVLSAEQVGQLAAIAESVLGALVAMDSPDADCPGSARADSGPPRSGPPGAGYPGGLPWRRR